LLDVVDGLAELVGQLRHATVVVEAGHGGELARVDVRRVALGDQGVGVGRVADYQNLDVTAGDVVDRLALYREDGGVGFQQVLALHARATRTGTDQQGEVGILECDFRVVGLHDAGEQRERAIFQFHGDAFQRFQCRGDFQQLQDNRLVRAEHGAGGNAEQQGIADLAGGTGNGNAYGSFHSTISLGRLWRRLAAVRGVGQPERRAL